MKWTPLDVFLRVQGRPKCGEHVYPSCSETFLVTFLPAFSHLFLTLLTCLCSFYFRLIDSSPQMAFYLREHHRPSLLCNPPSCFPSHDHHPPARLTLPNLLGLLANRINTTIPFFQPSYMLLGSWHFTSRSTYCLCPSCELFQAPWPLHQNQPTVNCTATILFSSSHCASSPPRLLPHSHKLSRTSYPSHANHPTIHPTVIICVQLLPLRRKTTPTLISLSQILSWSGHLISPKLRLSHSDKLYPARCLSNEKKFTILSPITNFLPLLVLCLETTLQSSCRHIVTAAPRTSIPHHSTVCHTLTNPPQLPTLLLTTTTCFSPLSAFVSGSLHFNLPPPYRLTHGYRSSPGPRTSSHCRTSYPGPLTLLYSHTTSYPTVYLTFTISLQLFLFQLTTASCTQNYNSLSPIRFRIQHTDFSLQYHDTDCLTLSSPYHTDTFFTIRNRAGFSCFISLLSHSLPLSHELFPARCRLNYSNTTVKSNVKICLRPFASPFLATSPFISLSQFVSGSSHLNLPPHHCSVQCFELSRYPCTITHYRPTLCLTLTNLLWVLVFRITTPPLLVHLIVTNRFLFISIGQATSFFYPPSVIQCFHRSRVATSQLSQYNTLSCILHHLLHYPPFFTSVKSSTVTFAGRMGIYSRVFVSA